MWFSFLALESVIFNAFFPELYLLNFVWLNQDYNTYFVIISIFLMYLCSSLYF